MKVALLMMKGRYAQAASVAEASAHEHRQRKNWRECLDMLAAAVKCHHLAGDPASAVTLSGELFQAEEDQLQKLPSPELLVSMLSQWPERYARAAFAAADTGDVTGAVTFAELGRFRVLSQQLGPAKTVPDGVNPDLWTAHVDNWRRVSAIAANRLVSSEEDDARRELVEPLTELKRTRGRLLESGIPRETLQPRNREVSVQHLLDGLPPDLVVLYPVILADDVRFFAVSSSLRAELDVSKQERTGILESCRTFAARMFGHQQNAQLWRETVNALLNALGSPMGRVVEEALQKSEARHLLWIPHGPLSILPLPACSLGRGHVLDRVAVIEAPSLRVGSHHLLVANDATARAVQAPVADAVKTDGGDTLVCRFDPNAGHERDVATLKELLAVAAESSVLFLSCHGVFSASSPLESRLRLTDEEPSLGDLIDARGFRADQLLVLGACESGTIRQSEMNEAIGIPTAALLAGAATVLGARWPVPRHMAAGFALKFFETLADGVPSAEAARVATMWLRDQDATSLAEALKSAGHPIARPLLLKLKRENMPIEPFDWAAYVHWGAVWRAPS